MHIIFIQNALFF